jgi:hypothetical protein
MDIFSVMMIAVSPGPARRVGINRMNIREYMNKKMIFYEKCGKSVNIMLFFNKKS